MSRALNLYRLQQTDTKLDQAAARLQSIQSILENDAELREAREIFSAAETQIKAAERALRQIEHEASDQQIKIEQTESSLYSGRVHNPKELQDLQKDIASLKKRLQTLEERELEAMLADEEARKTFQAASENLRAVEERVKAKLSQLTMEHDTIIKDVERLDAERAAIAAGVDPASLPEYDQLRQLKRGTAVTAVDDNACTACGASLPPALEQAARSSTQIAHCPSCGRILYGS
jgi:hypothetical protein